MGIKAVINNTVYLIGNVAEKNVSNKTNATPKPHVENFITDDLISGDISIEKQRDSLLLQHDIINFTKTPYRLEKVSPSARVTSYKKSSLLVFYHSSSRYTYINN